MMMPTAHHVQAPSETVLSIRLSFDEQKWRILDERRGSKWSHTTSYWEILFNKMPNQSIIPLGQEIISIERSALAQPAPRGRKRTWGAGMPRWQG